MNPLYVLFCCPFNAFRFRVRPLELVVRGLRQVHFSYSSAQQQEFMQRAESLLQYMTRAKQDSQQQQPAQAESQAPPAWSSQYED